MAVPYRWLMVGLVVAALVAAVGCSAMGNSGAAGIPDDEPGLTGTVTALERGDDDGAASILVEEYPDEEWDGGKGDVTLSDSSQIIDARGGEAEAASAADLQQGQRVDVWFDGPVAESYPVQGAADVVVIRDGGDADVGAQEGDEKTPQGDPYDGWPVYENDRFGYAISHPEGWEPGPEPQNGDGVVFDAGDEAADIRVYASHAPAEPDPSPPEGDLQEIETQDGRVAQVTTLDGEDGVVYDMRLVHEDVSYHLRAETPAEFFRAEGDRLEQMVRSFTLAPVGEEDGDSGSSDETAVPGGDPHAIGEVTDIDESGERPRVLVEEQPGTEEEGTKVHVTLTSSTQVLDGRGKTPTGAGVDDLETGQQVQVWYDGEVMDSYPQQAYGDVVLITEGGG